MTAAVEAEAPRAWVEVGALDRGQRVTVLVDVDDYIALAGRRVSIGSHGYAQIWEYPTLLLLHKWIMSVPTGTRYRVIVDHINRNRLDCRRSNLRLVTPTESNLNRVVAVRELPVGVYRTRTGRFEARLTRNRITRHLGAFDTPEQASAARDVALSLLDTPMDGAA